MKRYRRIQDGKEFIERERNSFRILLVDSDGKEHPVTKRHLEADFEPLIEVGGGE